MSADLEKQWRARYDRWAGIYGAEHLVSGWSERGLSRRLGMFMGALDSARLAQSARFLDLGAGPGVYTRFLKSLGHPCVALDYSHNVLELAKKKDLDGDYLQGEAYNLPFKPASFDALVCIGVLQSLANVNSALMEMRRVLAPGGWLFLDGLSSLFLVHSLRMLKERLKGDAPRMSYYDPFRITGELAAVGFAIGKVHWLVMPEAMQPCSRLLGKRGLRCLSRLLGYAFMVSARKVG